jgi:predicted RNase H-like HicB family nuclease
MKEIFNVLAIRASMGTSPIILNNWGEKKCFSPHCVIIHFGRIVMQYTVVIRKAPDGYYIASCPLVPEAHAQGESYEECLSNIKEVLTLCIEYRKEMSEEIPDEVGMDRITLAV